MDQVNLFREQIELPVNTKAYNDGFFEFRGLQITCGVGAFVETNDVNGFFESILSFIKEKIDLQDNLTMVDMGTGTGMLGIAMAIEVPNSVIYGVEKYEEPFFWTKKNADIFKEQINNNGSEFIPVMCSAIDSVDVLDQLHGQVDVIFASYPPVPLPTDLSKLDLTNVPYNLTAVFGGEDGLEVIKEIVTASSILLKKGGVLVATVPVQLFEQVKQLLEDSVWSEVTGSPFHVMFAVKN
jgi:release factor glutamine methyltransferase